ncbi:transporter [Klebsiella pneumoniae]|uniref:Transporter n=2 Tax=Klebsiella pneumoniae TaxID=573 RepID=A0A486R580_KLEPN|nr:hypothetical protein CEP04_22185 [Klebsiella pneumoniae]SXY80217.1 transporter [Klebsiella pneumoniae]VGH23369.1 transporter [Klebsiella pneumoniae]VGH27041.1 transporter [Klebsiella pneumoniae]VGH35799.1 transporter [Klebsiella pneumoniae]
MTQNNILLISGAILPVIITVIIGYISGKRKDFNWQQAGDINKIVMLYALPLRKVRISRSFLPKLTR